MNIQTNLQDLSHSRPSISLKNKEKSQEILIPDSSLLHTPKKIGKLARLLECPSNEPSPLYSISPKQFQRQHLSFQSLSSNKASNVFMNSSPSDNNLNRKSIEPQRKTAETMGNENDKKNSHLHSQKENVKPLISSIILLKEVLNSKILMFAHQKVIESAVDQLETYYFDEVNKKQTSIPPNLSNLQSQIKILSSKAENLKTSTNIFSSIRKQIEDLSEKYSILLSLKTDFENEVTHRLQQIIKVSPSSSLSECFLAIQNLMKSRLCQNTHEDSFSAHIPHYQSIDQKEQKLHNSNGKLSSAISGMRFQVERIGSIISRQRTSSIGKQSKSALELNILHQIKTLIDHFIVKKENESEKELELKLPNGLNEIDKTVINEIWNSIKSIFSSRVENEAKIEKLEASLTDALIKNEKLQLEAMIINNKAQLKI